MRGTWARGQNFWTTLYVQGAPGENLAITLHSLSTESRSDYLDLMWVRKDDMFPAAEETVLVKRLTGWAAQQTWIFADDAQVRFSHFFFFFFFPSNHGIRTVEKNKIT